MSFKGESYKWKDRKRYLGMPISFTRYALSDDRIFNQTGALNLNDEEVLLYRVRDISLKRTLWQRIFHVGTLTIASSDKSTPKLMLKNIKNPVEVKEIIHNSVEEMKIKRRIRIGEISSSSFDEDNIDDSE